MHYYALCNKNEYIDFIRILGQSEYFKRKEEKSGNFLFIWV